MSPPIRVPVLGTSGAYYTTRAEQVTGVDGALLAELSLTPRLAVKRTIAELRQARPLSLADRLAGLTAAGELFMHTVDGVTLSAHEKMVCSASGIAMSSVREASAAVARAAAAVEHSMRQARPAGVWQDWKNVRGAGAVWVRRGEVLAVQAPGNHPATHTIWLEALALGYRVAVRPSRREPFTPYRLISALRACGFGPDQVVLLPTDHHAVDALVDAADLALVYGGDSVARVYAGRADVFVQGPGRSKVLVADGNWEDHLETVVQSVIGYGATACVNASALFVNGDAPSAAHALARRFAEIPIRTPEDEDAVLPAFSVERAKALVADLQRRLGGAALIAERDLVVELGGCAVLRPAVALLDRATAPQAGIEMPFPCLWIAPWSRADGLEPLRNTLTLTAISEDEELLSLLADEPSIRNLHVGDRPTYVMAPGLPHDGHLAEFLMRSKTVIRDFPPATSCLLSQRGPRHARQAG